MRWMDNLKQSEFFRHVVTLTAGTFLAQLITVLMTPVLSRLYTPADYAVFAIFTSLVAQIAVGASLRLEMALPTVVNDHEASSLARFGVRISSWVSLFTLLGVGLYLILKTGISESWILLLAPIGILLTAMMQVLNFFSSRQKSFRLNATSRMVLSCFTGIVSIVFGFMHAGSNGLVYGFLAGLLAGVLILLVPLRGSVWPARNARTHFPARFFFDKYRHYMTVNTPHAFVDTLEVSGILLLMNRSFSPTDIGSYFFAYRILKLPVALIGASVFQVFYQRISAAKVSGESVQPMVRAVIRRMTLIGLPGFAILMAISPDLFAFAFGEEWRQSGELAVLMAPWLYFNFIASSVSSVTFLFNQQKSAFLITIVDLSVRLSWLFIAGLYFDFKITVLVMSCFSAGIMIFATWWYHRISRDHATV